MTPGLATRRISKTEKMKEPTQKPTALIGIRHIQIFMLTWIFLNCYATRITLSVALVAMTNSTVANPDFESFDWDDSTQNVILSSFYWGYVITQLPASIAAQNWGGHRILAFAASLCAIITLTIPSAAYYGGWMAVCACRAMVGLCQGMITPILHALLAKWAPLQERGRMTTFVYTGGWIGNVIALLSSGYLAASGWGWPSCFYIWGSITAFFAALWTFAGKECPADCPNIPLDEKEYIETSLGITETTQIITTPWRSILKSKNVWAVCVSQCCNMWGNVVLMTKMPSYLNSVLGFEITNNGLLSAAPYFFAWIFSFPLSYIADYSVRSKLLTLRNSRVIFNTLGELGPGLLLLGLGYIGKEHRIVAICLLILAVTANVSIFCGHHANHMDLSPNFAGPIMGFTNATASICSVIAPLVVAVVVTDARNEEQWKSIFMMTSGIYILGSISFAAFGSVKVQPWNSPEETPRESKFEDTFDIISISEYIQNREKAQENR